MWIVFKEILWWQRGTECHMSCPLLPSVMAHATDSQVGLISLAGGQTEGLDTGLVLSPRFARERMRSFFFVTQPWFGSSHGLFRAELFFVCGICCVIGQKFEVSIAEFL